MSIGAGEVPVVPADAPAQSGTAREAILAAAVHEFAERGYEGVRIGHVAARAGCNRALVYRYFGDREGLFREAIRAQFTRRAKLLEHVPDALPDLLQWWSRATLDDPTFIRVILRESLDYQGGDPIESEARRAYYEAQLAMIDDLRLRGELDARFDREMLFLTLLSVVVLPAILPQLVRIVTGDSVHSEAFQERWEGFLRALAPALAAR